ncbi:hypothetical protein CLHOM_01690 [Clostridium homopropionicum DSM 5847]|uniref:DUF3787 domain-containing protein n=1 Tax=Clostridium homopropionicum DSM 5847 TaxID=1121318 RepID=A0A0L6ZFD0_9CLOT|nr:DUF3787 domain-containing protein [Clostridium homopropionicum]KOA21498.1 hypothetical protein CLHOM_01690 [Clostridium homopropionicum DSM 5847]SFG07748.1 protein of unknown function [Clostridium homopropionicum]
MAKNKFKERFLSTPIERHETAAWANIETAKPVSKVSVPSDFQIGEAKDWVEENQK